MTGPRVKRDEWRHVEEILLAALEKDGDARSRYLDEACRGNAGLRAEVESLLAHDSDGTQVLKSVVSEAASKLAGSPDKHIDSKIGPYRILRRLDEGGMGVVYLAERSDEQYLQTVAIKLVKSGMDSREIVNRFRAERQILANLTHPNVAAILDGGSTEDGSPYIVMEYIDGQRITDFAAARQLTVRERIHLFLPVCLAVHYAHQKLVIHRDIKPGNILVTADGNPKLLDFGIAKLLADDSPIAQGLTLTGMRAMTPDYSSPEQVRGESLTTASDVYSLGIVLFELLTGSHPYSTKGLSPGQLEQVVCAAKRSKPSETPGLGNRLARELRGDLDNIVLVAMRTEPERRYKSAEQLAEDLTRYLSGEPVIARTDTPFYRAGKFFRRHKTGIAAILALVATMAAGTIVATREARMAQARADDMQKLIESVVVKTNNDLMNLPQSTEVRAALLKNTIENLDRLAKEPGIPPKLLMQISGAYVQAGQVQGLRVGAANVGHEEESLRSMEKAVQIAERVAAKGSSDPDLPRVRLTAHFNLAQIQLLLGDLAKAQVNYTAALNLAKAWEAVKPTAPQRRQVLAATFSGVADLEIRQGQVRESAANYRAALGVLEPIDAGASELTRDTAGRCYNSLGVALAEVGPLAAALDAYRSAAKIREGLVEQYPSNVLYQRRLEVTYINIGLVLGSEDGLGDPATAAVYVTKGREIAERLANLDSSNKQARDDLAGVYENIGRVQSRLNPAAAVDWFLRSIAITRELLEISPVSVDYREWLGIREWEVAETLGRTNRIQGALGQALASRDDLFNLVRSQPPRKDFSRDLMKSYCVLADLQHQARDDAGASLSQQAAMHLFNVVEAGEENLDSDYSLAKCYEVFSRTDSAHSAEWLQKSGERWQTLTAAGVHR
jgi:serine/threonine protein kinase/tetratricopeptide (TPR) repeat protein